MEGLDEKSLRHRGSIEAIARMDGCSLLLHGRVPAIPWAPLREVLTAREQSPFHNYTTWNAAVLLCPYLWLVSLCK